MTDETKKDETTSEEKPHFPEQKREESNKAGTIEPETTVAKEEKESAKNSK